MVTTTSSKYVRVDSVGPRLNDLQLAEETRETHFVTGWRESPQMFFSMRCKTSFYYSEQFIVCVHKRPVFLPRIPAKKLLTPYIFQT